jgi:hypothetical protein
MHKRGLSILVRNKLMRESRLRRDHNQEWCPKRPNYYVASSPCHPTIHSSRQYLCKRNTPTCTKGTWLRPYHAWRFIVSGQPSCMVRPESCPFCACGSVSFAEILSRGMYSILISLFISPKIRRNEKAGLTAYFQDCPPRCKLQDSGKIFQRWKTSPIIRSFPLSGKHIWEGRYRVVLLLPGCCFCSI